MKNKICESNKDLLLLEGKIADNIMINEHNDLNMYFPIKLSTNHYIVKGILLTF